MKLECPLIAFPWVPAEGWCGVQAGLMTAQQRPRAGKPGGVLGSLDSGQKDPRSYVNIVHSFSGREAAKADLCLVTWQLCLICAVNETSFSF